MLTFLVFFISVPVYFFQLEVFASTKEKNILSSHFAIFTLFFFHHFVVFYSFSIPLLILRLLFPNTIDFVFISFLRKD